MKKILGLDLGVGSIGWALVNEAEQCEKKCYQAFHVSNCIKKRAFFRHHPKCSWTSITYCSN